MRHTRRNLVNSCVVVCQKVWSRNVHRGNRHHHNFGVASQRRLFPRLHHSQRNLRCINKDYRIQKLFRKTSFKYSQSAFRIHNFYGGCRRNNWNGLYQPEFSNQNVWRGGFLHGFTRHRRHYRKYIGNHVDESPLHEDKRIHGENMNSSETRVGSDIVNLVEKGAEFHGHLGPFLVLGVRAGLAGLRELGVPRKFGQMCVTAKLKLSVPFSCFIDGVQVTTNCTVGNRLLRLEDSQRGITVCFKPKDSDEELTIRVKPEILRYLMNKFSEGVSNEELAWEIASLPEDKLFTMVKQ
ncbi:hypothetical protein DRO25_00010 [Candidatus Bathyarchaeota archaeon]|nr:MAG: hypothetical protein DRO25_00010 [Candidatus Bathyarchaeota archaeon]